MMASTTLLQATNKVLTRLREKTVTAITDNDYAGLIAEFVGDANDYVESRWEWVALEESITVTTSSGTAEYEVNGAGESGVIQHVVDDTNNRILQFRSMDDLRIAELISSPANSQPVHYSHSSVASDGDMQITFSPTPDGTYTIIVQVDKSGSPLSSGSDVLLVPLQAVIQMAYALALDERGDTGGSTGRAQFALAETYIATAIMRDAAKRPESTTWTVAGERSERTNHGSKP